MMKGRKQSGWSVAGIQRNESGVNRANQRPQMSWHSLEGACIKNLG